MGLGVDTDGELSRFGEDPDSRVLAAKLDEALELVLALWSGTEVSHAGRYYREFVRAGATWALWQFYPPGPGVDVMRAVAAGPAAGAR